jgi:hypothetical protein
MVYKLFREEGNYRNKLNGEPRNLIEAEIAYTPDGINVDWDEFDSIEEAMEHYNIELIPVEQNDENDI